MTPHHLVKEEDGKVRCMYCGTGFEEKGWHTTHNSRKHYKTNICKNCGRTAKIEVAFEGSGHDSWGHQWKGKEEKTRSKVVVVESPLEKAIKNHEF